MRRHSHPTCFQGASGGVWLAAACGLAMAVLPVRGEAVSASIAQAVEDAAARSVEDRIEASAVESAAARQQEAVARQVENAVEASVRNRADGAVVQQIERSVTEQVEGAVAARAEESVAERVEADVLVRAQAALADRVELGVLRRAEGALADRLEAALAARAEAARGRGLDEAVERGVAPADAARSPALATSGAPGGETRTLDQFAEMVDPLGRNAERGVWVMLIAPENLERIADWGFNVREQRELAGLGRVLVRFDAPENRQLAQVALEVALDAPGTVVDYNHVYRPEQGARDAARCEAEPVQHAPLFRLDFDGQETTGLAIGLIDSQVSTAHPALAGARIESRDFVSHHGERPLAHGTAVASILVGESGGHAGLLPQARLLAASVFFLDGAGAQGATTASLVEALNWHQERGVEVINMSLAGPPNSVLEAALERIAAEHRIVVAAVGNNGPVGAAMYPAAYETVVGVTAVDSCDRAYRLANRGPQVMFSAPGVDVRVADAAGGLRSMSGTSMAAPYAAAVIASTRAEIGDVHQLLEVLKIYALDLGAEGPDEIYGYGLITMPDVLALGAAGR